MKEETFCELLKKYIIEDYEGFCLVHLPSGKWCALWHEFTHDEEAIEMLFDWKWWWEYCLTKIEALQIIIDSYEQEIINTRNNNDDYSKRMLKKAKISMIKEREGLIQK